VRELAMASKSIKAVFKEQEVVLEVACSGSTSGAQALAAAVQAKVRELGMDWEGAGLTIVAQESDSQHPTCAGTAANFPWDSGWKVCSNRCELHVGVTTGVAGGAAGGGGGGSRDAGAGHGQHGQGPGTAEGGEADGTVMRTLVPSLPLAGAPIGQGIAPAAALGMGTGQAASRGDCSNSSSSDKAEKKAKAANMRKQGRVSAKADEPKTCRTPRHLDVLNAVVRGVGGSPACADLGLTAGLVVASQAEVKVLVAEHAECNMARGKGNRTAVRYSLSGKAMERWREVDDGKRKKPASTVTLVRAVCHDFGNCQFVAEFKKRTGGWTCTQFETHTNCSMPQHATAYTSGQLASGMAGGGTTPSFKGLTSEALRTTVDKFTKGDTSKGDMRGVLSRSRLKLKVKLTGTLEEGLRDLQPWLRALRRLGHHARMLQPFDAETVDRLNLVFAQKQHRRSQQHLAESERTTFDKASVPPSDQSRKYFHGYIIFFNAALNMMKNGLLDGVFSTDVCHNQSGPGVFFFLVGYDANRSIIYLGFMFTVATESSLTWTLFFKGAKGFFGDNFDDKKNRLLTDADKGCFKASDLGLKSIVLFLCHVHLRKNLAKNKGITHEMINLLEAAIKLKDRTAALRAWDNLPKALLAYFEKEKVGAANILPCVASRMRGRWTNNQSESANNAVAEARKCGNYVYAGHMIVNYVAQTHGRLALEAQACTTDLAPRPQQDIQAVYTRLFGLAPSITAIGQDKFVVVFGTNDKNTVDLAYLTCTCGVYACDSTLCICLVAAIDKSSTHGSVTSNVDACYKTAMWRAQRGMLFGVPGASRPLPDSGSSSDEEVHGPPQITQRGAPQRIRRKGVLERGRAATSNRAAGALRLATNTTNAVPRLQPVDNGPTETVRTDGDAVAATTKTNRAVASVALNGGSDHVPLPGARSGVRAQRADFEEWSKDHEAHCAGCNKDTNTVVGSAKLHCYSCPRTLCEPGCQFRCDTLMVAVSSVRQCWIMAHVAQPPGQPVAVAFCQDCWWQHSRDAQQQLAVLTTSACGEAPPAHQTLQVGAARHMLAGQGCASRDTVPVSEVEERVMLLLPQSEQAGVRAAVCEACSGGWGNTGRRRWRLVPDYKGPAAAMPVATFVHVEILPPPAAAGEPKSGHESLAVMLAQHPSGMQADAVAAPGAGLMRQCVQLGHFNRSGSGAITVAPETLAHYPSADHAALLANLTSDDIFQALQELGLGREPSLHATSNAVLKPQLEDKFGGPLVNKEVEILQAVTKYCELLDEEERYVVRTLLTNAFFFCYLLTRSSSTCFPSTSQQHQRQRRWQRLWQQQCFIPEVRTQYRPFLVRRGQEHSPHWSF